MKRKIVSILLLVLGAVGPPARTADPIAPSSGVTPVFERDIRPIFRAYCLDCHGAAKKKKGSLDLRLARLTRLGGKSGAAIVPGEPARSLLLKRVREGEMPPGEIRLDSEKIAVLERWIAGGAKTSGPEPDTIGEGIGITAHERDFWSLQPIVRSPVPSVDDPRARTDIDAFVVNAMPDGLSLSPDARPLTLLLRASFDLTGLPPDHDVVDEFLADPSDAAYERLVDRLLSSPAFGERWSRHWLDVAGYADSEGGSNRDGIRPWAYKYRDYVIRSMGHDVPLDRFLTEQLAGDELAGTKDGDWTERQIELLTATGFLRMAADGTRDRNSSEFRNAVVADTLKIVSSSLLGFSLACAQCHDHRYDPILQTDYYAVRAIFEPALDWKSWRTPEQRGVSLYTRADRQAAERIESQAQTLAREKEAKQSRYMAEALTKELEKYEAPLRGSLRRAYETPAGKRTEEDNALLKRYPSVNLHPGVLYQYDQKAADDLKTYDKRIADVRATKPAEEFVRALTEPPAHTPTTFRFHRGDHREPREAVSPGTLTALSPVGAGRAVLPGNDANLPTTGRRLAFARWLSSEHNPTTARVLANRIWMHLFGRGLVATPSDFGKLGSKPTHPELLDALALSLYESGWSLKRSLRSIMLSTVYRQSSRRDPDRDTIDRSNLYYWRQSVRRLDAEVVRDRMLAVTAKLGRSLWGPAVAVTEDETGQVLVPPGTRRRSVYVQSRRSQPVALLEVFDAPVMVTNCERRSSSTVATQSLMLLNGAFVLEQAAALADRARREAVDIVNAPILAGVEVDVALSKIDTPPILAQAATAWQLAYQRPAGREELRLAASFLRRQIDTLTRSPRKLPGARGPTEQAISNLCHMLLVSNEFLYVE